VEARVSGRAHSLDGFRLIGAVDVHGEVWQPVKTIETMVGSPACGTRPAQGPSHAAVAGSVRRWSADGARVAQAHPTLPRPTVRPRLGPSSVTTSVCRPEMHAQPVTRIRSRPPSFVAQGHLMYWESSVSPFRRPPRDVAQLPASSFRIGALSLGSATGPRADAPNRGAGCPGSTLFDNVSESSIRSAPTLPRERAQ